ncbi:MAG: DEAD/DEAH box helicase, partial [Cyanobacteria bacterium P01_A01_bin.68]
KILHGTWIPNAEPNFIQTGCFCLWVEVPYSKKETGQTKTHPGHLEKEDLVTLLTQELGLKENILLLQERISSKYFALPTANNQPLPSPELTKYLEVEATTEYEDFRYWKIDCYKTVTPTKTDSSHIATAVNVIKFINDIHFLALYNLGEFQLGSDLLFWYHYTQAFKPIIFKDQYIPALKYRELETTAAKRKSKQKSHQSNNFEIYPTWEIISEQYEANIKKYVEYMPAICVAGSSIFSDTVEFFEPESLLRHFSEYLIHNLLTHTQSTAAFSKKISDSLIYHCLDSRKHHPLTTNNQAEEYQKWLTWKNKINRTTADSTFHLCFQLDSATADYIDNWQMHFLVSSKKDPSLKLSLADYWTQNAKAKTNMHKDFGKDFETNLLLNLGYAARMYPNLWKGLETQQPTGLQLTLDEAFDFLKESAWVLEDSGFKVIVPSWYTPTGRRRAKIKLKASSGKNGASKSKTKSYFDLNSLVQYRYELAIGEQVVTQKEWEQLVNAKSPLVHFRGQWMELDRDKMQQLLEFWQQNADEQPEMNLLEFLHKSAEAGDEWEIEHDEALSAMMGKLQDKSQLEPVSELINLQGTLREYQKRGVSWLDYLERLGLNGCLADDMGLGKSVQVIARLIQEKEQVDEENNLTTLLIAPTSVVGNWQKEIAKFAPHLKTIVHHGGNRIQATTEFKAACKEHDVVISSFTLARKDEKLLNSIKWQRVVLDEAQNIKNPKAAQTKAILKLSAKHRLALTGTPVENRLLDLWSIFNFLNPGYLGKQAQFRKSFEIPIQKDNDKVKSTTLKKLVEPLILRRVKTDQSIISDLPDKVEHKLYTNLTKEQASLYEVVVKDVEKQLQ